MTARDFMVKILISRSELSPFPMPWSWKRKPTSSQKLPEDISEEKQRKHIERVAYELYQNRLLLGRPGDAQSDWETATKIVQSDWCTTLFAIHRPFIQLEKNVWEPLLAWANNQALLSLLGLVGNVGLIIAVATYIGSEKQRRDAEVLNAWQTLTSAHGQAGNGGRIRALEFLNASPGANWRRRFPWFCAPHPICVWPSESLAGVNLSVESEDTVGNEAESTSAEEGGTKYIGQEGGSADGTQGRGGIGRVYLSLIQLPGAHLATANFQGADLAAVNFQDANLRFANLQDSFLIWANLQGADLRGANLQNSFLEIANLQGADLRGANLRDANLATTNLRDANLATTNLRDAIFLGTDLRSTRYLRQEDLNSDSPPLICNSPLPPGIKIKDGKDRDCDQMVSALLEHFPDAFGSLENAEAFVKRHRKKTWD